MSSPILIADSGATKCDWCYVVEGKKINFTTVGISPYFLPPAEMQALLKQEVRPIAEDVHKIYFYGTGMGVKQNISTFTDTFSSVFPKSEVFVSDDMLGAAISVCANRKGIVSILGTGSGACFYNGEKIEKSRLGLGYVLGDEGSGTYFGKKVIQHFLYDIFDEELRQKFEDQFANNRAEILNHVYKQPFANRYIASFTLFLVENRGHYIVENIIEDGISDFVHTHLYKFKEAWNMPVNFVGSIAHGFKDIIYSVCHTAGLELGNIIHKPLDGLVQYHLNYNN